MDRKTRRMMRILRAKPYLLDPFRCRNYKEARLMIKSEGLPSDAKLISLAKSRSINLPDDVQACLENQMLKLEIRTKKNTAIRRSGARLGRVAISFIIVGGLLIGYLVFTPSGRAFAVSVYETVVRIVQGILYVEPAGVSEVDQGTIQTVPSSPLEEDIQLATIEELIELFEGDVY